MTTSWWRPVSVGLLVLVATLTLSVFSPNDAGDALTRNTIRLSLAWYFAALALMLRMHNADWAAATPLGRLTRWCWTWGVLCFLVHLTMAFHYFHHWSHWQAFEHTREVSGVGEGLYASYLFTLVWLIDCVWWWLWPARYAARSVWIDRALHAFMLFIVFNGTVVFEAGAIRWVSLAAFLALLAMWVYKRRHIKRRMYDAN